MGLITETNYQYYEGEQVFTVTAATEEFTCTFDTVMLDITSEHPSNYIIQESTTPAPPVSAWNTLPTTSYSVSQNVVRVTGLTAGHLVRVKLIQPAVWDNYGGYEYIKLNDVIDNFLVAYVGEDKIIPKVKRTDVIFHAKRGLQEFSYDTLKSVKSIELEIPPSLSYPIPQDYVNYVQLSWVDGLGVKHIIYPANNLTSSPSNTPIQDGYYNGLPTQDDWGENLEAQQSIVNERWRTADDRNLTGDWDENWFGVYDWNWWKMVYGQRYGLEPQVSQRNGWFNIDPKRNKFNFSSDLTGKLILLNYISDGLGYDLDMKVPKMAEEALYMHILHAILSTRAGINEYTIRRFKKERFAALRNAKIRLSNIKLEAFTQVMRGKSKWIKR